MNKSIPFVANSILFVLGICGLVFNNRYISALCLLVISFLFIWCYGISNDILTQEKSADEENKIRAEAEKQQMANRIKSLTEINNRLTQDNDSLKQTIVKLDEKKPVEPKVQKVNYLCPLTSAVPIMLDKFFKTYVDNYSGKLTKSKITVEYNSQVQELSTYLSESALSIICGNIFDNLIKFSPENSKVFIMITQMDGDGLVIFKNYGKGISESESEKIFDINYKGSNSKGGNGLGLSQVKDIIEDFGGHVWGKSTPETGFTLYLQIPKQLKGAGYE